MWGRKKSSSVAPSPPSNNNPNESPLFKRVRGAFETGKVPENLKKPNNNNNLKITNYDNLRTDNLYSINNIIYRFVNKYPTRKRNGSYIYQMIFTLADNDKELLRIYSNNFDNFEIYEISHILNPDELYVRSYNIDPQFKPFMRRSRKTRKNKKTRRRTRR